MAARQWICPRLIGKIFPKPDSNVAFLWPPWHTFVKDVSWARAFVPDSHAVAEFGKGNSMDLKKLRVEKGWSQEQLAEISGISARTIQRLE